MSNYNKHELQNPEWLDDIMDIYDINNNYTPFRVSNVGAINGIYEISNNSFEINCISINFLTSRLNNDINLRLFNIICYIKEHGFIKGKLLYKNNLGHVVRLNLIISKFIERDLYIISVQETIYHNIIERYSRYFCYMSENTDIIMIEHPVN